MSDEARRIAAGGEEARRLEKTRRAGYIMLGQLQNE